MTCTCSVFPNVDDVPGVEREWELVGAREAMTSDLLHPAENFTLCQGPPQMGH